MEEPNTVENEKASVMPAEDKEEMYICDIVRAMDFTAKEPQMNISENSRIILC